MDIKSNEMTRCQDEGAQCPGMPELKRLRYFYGQMLGVNDFQAEQNYFREKLKLHNRCLHGYGTVCGLMVVPEPHDEECLPESDKQRAELEQALKDTSAKIDRANAAIAALNQEAAKAKEAGDQEALRKIEEELKKQQDGLGQLKAQQEKIRQELDALAKGGQQTDCSHETPTRVIVECGYAIDCNGNEIIVRRPLAVDLWHYLSSEDRRRVDDGETTLYLSICYCEQPVDPVRPVISDACGATMDCTYGKLRDAVRIEVTVDAPKSDVCCEPCCNACEEACLLLARIDNFHRGIALAPGDVDNSVRRLISVYPPTTITGISWTHGAEYTQDEAYTMLGTEGSSAGLKVRFSRPVLVSTLARGVIDMCVVEGGGTKHSGMYQLEVDYVGLAGTTASGVRFRYTGDETLEPGDRVLITIRCAFILDGCCRAVDGTHVGGRVPIIDDAEFKQYDRTSAAQDCADPPGGYGPWTSGVGIPGGTFESWFYIQQKTAAKARRTQEEQS